MLGDGSVFLNIAQRADIVKVFAVTAPHRRLIDAPELTGHATPDSMW